jgi:glycine cleavage system transcriptional repressor
MKMAKRYILTVLASNRSGVLAALTNAMDELRGNMLDVSQAVIQDFFTMILAAEFPEDRDSEVIVDHIRAVCRPFGAEVALKDPDSEPEFEIIDEPAPRQRYLLTVSGRDRPGVLRFIAHRLAQDDIELLDLQGKQIESDHSFLTSMELAVPPGIDALKLRSDLDVEFRSDGITVALQHRRVLAALAHPEPVGFNTVSPRFVLNDAPPNRGL